MADKFHFKIVITLCPFGFLGKPRNGSYKLPVKIRRSCKLRRAELRCAKLRRAETSQLTFEKSLLTTIDHFIKASKLSLL